MDASLEENGQQRHEWISSQEVFRFPVFQKEGKDALSICCVLFIAALTVEKEFQGFCKDLSIHMKCME